MATRGIVVTEKRAVTADASPGSSLLVAAAPSLRLIGFTAREAAGSPAAAAFRLVDGPSGNQVTNGTFTGASTGWTLGAGWAYGSNKITFTPGTPTDLEQTLSEPLIAGRSYSVAYTMADRAAGTCTVSLGGTAGTARSSNATHTETIVAGSTQKIAFTPSALFDGSVDTVTATLTLLGVVAPVSLAASGFVQAWYGEGLPIPNGLSLDWVAGEFDVSIYTREVNA